MFQIKALETIWYSLDHGSNPSVGCRTSNIECRTLSLYCAWYMEIQGPYLPPNKEIQIEAMEKQAP